MAVSQKIKQDALSADFHRKVRGVSEKPSTLLHSSVKSGIRCVSGPCNTSSCKYEIVEGSRLVSVDTNACPVATTVELIGSKWKLLIMRNLLVRPWRFNELRRDLEGISQKVLTDSLRSMEENGIITRTVYPEVPPRVEYALSELGESMRPIMDAMEQWGTAYKASRANG